MSQTPTEMSPQRQKFLAFLAKYDVLVKHHDDYFDGLVKSKMPTYGHGKDHDYLMAAYCLMIVPRGMERVGELGAISAFVDSIHHQLKGKAAIKKINEFISCLPSSVTLAERRIIRRAVDNHSKQKLNVRCDVTRALRDAAKLSNNGFLNLFRGGQHHPYLPVILLEFVRTHDPACGFKAKDRTNIFNLLDFCLMWRRTLHFPKSRKIADMPFSIAGTQHAKDMVIRQFEHAGLID